MYFRGVRYRSCLVKLLERSYNGNPEDSVQSSRDGHRGGYGHHPGQTNVPEDLHVDSVEATRDGVGVDHTPSYSSSHHGHDLTVSGGGWNA